MTEHEIMIVVQECLDQCLLYRVVDAFKRIATFSQRIARLDQGMCLSDG